MNDKVITNAKPFFDKTTTLELKGIAMIIMFFHHFLTFPDWWIIPDITYPSTASLAPYLQLPGKICVSIFCFLTGYTYFFAKEKTYKYSARKISNILINYWVVYLILAIIAVTVVDYKYTPIGIAMEMFGLSRPTMNFCWYIPYYILMMLILPVFAKFENKSPLTNIVLPLAIILVLFELGCKIPNMDIIYTFSYIYEYGPIMLSGYLFAHYNLFDYLQEKFDKIFIFKQLRVIICVILAFAIPASKYFIRSFSLAATIPLLSKTSLFLSYDIVSTPLFIFVLVNIINVANTKYIKMGLIELGKLSALMWFVSCAFYDNCYTIFQPILYIPHNPVLVLIWGTILCFIPAYLINMMLQFIIKKSSNITIK